MCECRLEEGNIFRSCMFTVGPWAGGGYWLKLVNLDTEADRVSATNSYFLIPISLHLQTINSVRLNSLSLKYKRFTPSSCKDRGIRRFKLVEKT